MGIEGQRYNERSVIGRVSASSCVSGPGDLDQQRGRYKSRKSRTATKGAGPIVYHSVFVAGSRVGCFTPPNVLRHVPSLSRLHSSVQLPSPSSSFGSSPMLDILAFGMSNIQEEGRKPGSMGSAGVISRETWVV